MRLNLPRYATYYGRSRPPSDRIASAARSDCVRRPIRFRPPPDRIPSAVQSDSVRRPIGSRSVHDERTWAFASLKTCVYHAKVVTIEDTFLSFTMLSNCSLFRKYSSKRVRLSDLICIFAMSYQSSYKQDIMFSPKAKLSVWGFIFQLFKFMC